MEQEQPAAAAEKHRGKPAGRKKGCWPWAKEVEEVPLFDDVNCPYPIKPSELFKINEVSQWELCWHWRATRLLIGSAACTDYDHT
jgi:hypothetical protein